MEGMNMLMEHDRPSNHRLGEGGYGYNGYPYGRRYGYDGGASVKGAVGGGGYGHRGGAPAEVATGGGGYVYEGY
jgi:hypothetical protein